LSNDESDELELRIVVELLVLDDYAYRPQLVAAAVADQRRGSKLVACKSSSLMYAVAGQ
jgi:hypothetical protein